MEWLSASADILGSALHFQIQVTDTKGCQKKFQWLLEGDLWK